MNIWCFSSKNKTNVFAAIGAGKWAYANTQKSHGGIKPGDYIILYSGQTKCLECVGIVLTEPEFGIEITDDLWEKKWFDPFSFMVIAKKSIPLAEVNNILQTDVNLNEYLSLFYANAPATLSSQDIAKLINVML